MVRLRRESKLRPGAVRVPVPCESGSWTGTGWAPTVRVSVRPYVLSWNGFLVPAATENLPCLCRHPLKIEAQLIQFPHRDQAESHSKRDPPSSIFETMGWVLFLYRNEFPLGK